MKKGFDLKKGYNKEAIFTTLDLLDIKKGAENVVETYYENRLISSVEVSEQYQIFDFSTFAKDALNQVENFFEPESYTLRIRKGEQELRLIGEEIIINDEVYHKMFNILNSTDKSKALQINVGLIRRICNNGLVIEGENSASSLRTKHYKSKLSDRLDKFESDIAKFNISIDYQADIIQKLKNKKVSFFDLAKRYIINSKGEIEESKILKFKAFGKKLLTSSTDSLKNLTSEQIKLISNIESVVKNNITLVDIELTGSQVFNCYTELFRNYDSAVIHRETNRILELI